MQERTASPDLFGSEPSQSNERFTPEDSNDNGDWRGVPMSDIYRGKSPFHYYSPPISPSRNHTVLFEVPILPGNHPKPHYTSNACHWNNEHVKMPFSHKNLYPIKEGGEDVLKPRWDLIQLALLRPIKTSQELEEAIASYNSKIANCEALHYFLNEGLCEEESEMFFESLLPKIIQLALQLPELIPSPIPLLKQGKNHSISLSQMQVASLVANGFLCTFPWRRDMTSYPGLNFYDLFRCCGRNSEDTSSVSEKLKCITHYFRRVSDNPPNGVITFERRYSQKANLPRWDRLENKVADSKLHVSSSGTIEEAGKGLLQVDFANCYVGGGVLGRGCVQEEIRFVTWPELLVSRLFTEKLGPTEALHVTGIECFSKYEGYAESFRWAGDYQDDTARDTSGRKRTTLVAIDALFYHKPSLQFCPSRMIRELNKAYVGYKGHTSSSQNSNSDESNDRSHLPAVATGNWGCGAFRGNVRLKGLLQMMACSAANRDIVYYTFGDTRLRDLLYGIHTFFQRYDVTISQLWRYLCRFNEAQLAPKQLYPFIQQAHLESMQIKNTSVKEKQQTIKQVFERKLHQGNSNDNQTVNINKTTDVKKISKETSKSNYMTENSKLEASQEVVNEDAITNEIIESTLLTSDVPRNYISEFHVKKPKIVPNKNEFKKNHEALKTFLYSSDEEDSDNNPGTSNSTGFIETIDSITVTTKTTVELKCPQENSSLEVNINTFESMECDEIIEDSQEEDEEIEILNKLPTPSKKVATSNSPIKNSSNNTPIRNSSSRTPQKSNNEKKITDFFKTVTK